MPILSKPSPLAGASLVYITLGALIDVWSGIGLWYLRDHGGSDTQFYWCWGFLLSGATLFLIGLAVGHIGRAARHAEMPPAEVTPAAEQATVEAAQRAPIMAPINVAQPVAGTPTAMVPSTQPTAPVAQRV